MLRTTKSVIRKILITSLILFTSSNVYACTCFGSGWCGCAGPNPIEFLPFFLISILALLATLYACCFLRRYLQKKSRKKMLDIDQQMKITQFDANHPTYTASQVLPVKVFMASLLFAIMVFPSDVFIFGLHFTYVLATVAVFLIFCFLIIYIRKERQHYNHLKSLSITSSYTKLTLILNFIYTLIMFVVSSMLWVALFIWMQASSNFWLYVSEYSNIPEWYAFNHSIIGMVVKAATIILIPVLIILFIYHYKKYLRYMAKK